MGSSCPRRRTLLLQSGRQKAQSCSINRIAIKEAKLIPISIYKMHDWDFMGNGYISTYMYMYIIYIQIYVYSVAILPRALFHRNWTLTIWLQFWLFGNWSWSLAWVGGPCTHNARSQTTCCPNTSLPPLPHIAIGWRPWLLVFSTGIVERLPVSGWLGNGTAMVRAKEEVKALQEMAGGGTMMAIRKEMA